jgi:hypothetical protein
MRKFTPSVRLIVVWASLAIAGSVLAGEAPTQIRSVNSFERPSDFANLKGTDANLAPTPVGVTEGKYALRVDFTEAAYPKFVFITATPLDWRGFTGLALDVTNPGTEAVQFQMRVDDAPNAKGPEHVAFGSGNIEPGRTATFVLRAGEGAPANYGMLALPPEPGMRTLANKGARIDFSHVYSWQVYLRRPTSRHTLIFDNVRTVALKSLNLDKIVDSFGQYTRVDWPGKTHNQSELQTQRAVEESKLRANLSLRDRDRFGGWTRGPKLPKSAFFRLHRLKGKWWLVDPDGRLFLSFGVNTVTPSVPVFVSNRQSMFEWLPRANEPLGRHYGQGKSMAGGPVVEGPTYDFLAANLERKYGPNFIELWRQTALVRLRAWGFNTLGKTCDADLYRSGRVPYIPIVQFSGNYAHVSAGQDTWGPMHDPFDAAFRQAAAAQLAKVVTTSRDDPWCIGYFVDNELSWGSGKSTDPTLRYGLALGALKQRAEASPAKQAFMVQLKQTYGTVSKLNAAWKTRLAGWDDLNAAFAPASVSGAAMEGDFSRFLKSFATKYFTVVRDELLRLDPNHLYLGCRFASFTPEAVEAAAEACDALSFNIYQPRIDKEWDFLKTLAKPSVIGEFHMGALDRGMFSPGLVEAADQTARAAMVQDYVRSVVDHPALIGCHWFRYDDEPLLGHVSNGENHNIGMVSITDTPYPELIAAFRNVFSEAYARRFRTARPAR